jgi:CcmD family protein
MEYLLWGTYAVVFATLVLYVIHLRSRLRELEGRLEDLTSARDADN